MTTTRFLIVAFALAACRGEEKETPVVRTAAVTPSMTPNTTPPPPTTDPAKPTKVEDLKKGDKKDDEWVPAEFKTGAARWKDTGVYLDGKPIGFLQWGDLPLGLKPTWVKDRISTKKRAGTKDLGWRWGQQRFYRFTDYLTAMGLDVRKIKEVHVYGPRFTNSTIATTKDLLSPLAKDFMFRFGSNVSGKAIPHVPAGFGSGRPADKISGVMIYIEKKPPTLTEEGFDLDGVPQEGIPYYGEPIRGGVRVYLDNRLAAIIKRQELDVSKATKNADGDPVWKLEELLASQGVDTKSVAEIWVIRDERRGERFPGTELAAMTFQASIQAKGGVLLTEKAIRTNAIALHTKPVAPEELPTVIADDD